MTDPDHPTGAGTGAGRTAWRPGDDGYDEFFDDDGYDDGDFVRIPRRAAEVPGFFSLRLVLALGVLLAVVFSGLWIVRQFDPAGAPGDPIVVEIPEGATTQQVADVLADAGVISNSRLFQEYVRFKGGGSSINAGTYTLAEGMALWEALDVLRAGPAPEGYLVLTVPEGLRVSEMVPVIVEQIPRFTPEGFDAALRSGNVASTYLPADGNLEGLLFPDTYQVGDEADELAVLNLMTGQFDAVAREIDLDARAAALGYTPYEIIIIASMIEEEARLPEERDRIARVIYNRLDEGMQLGIDATTLYAVGKQGNTLTVSDLDSDSPYNTRKVTGLPPGPISSPSRASLEAALAPADGAWLYYVLADADGRHAFTDDPDEFDRLVDAADAKGLLG